MRILRRLRFRRRVRFFFHLARILAAALCCGVEERGMRADDVCGFWAKRGRKAKLPHTRGCFRGSVGHRSAWLRYHRIVGRVSGAVARAFGTSTSSRTARGARLLGGPRAPSSRQSDRRASSTPPVSGVCLRGSSPRASVFRVFAASSSPGHAARRRRLRAIQSVGFHDLPSIDFPLALFAPPRLSSSAPWVSPSVTC